MILFVYYSGKLTIYLITNFPFWKTLVHLHHIVSSRQIGEKLFANYIAPNVMSFELANKRGHRLRVKSYGAVGTITNHPTIVLALA